MSASSIDWSGRTLRITTAEDAAPLVSAIQENPSATEIVLSGNTFGVEGAAAVAASLKEHRQLQRAILSDMFTTRLYTEVPPAVASFAQVLAQLGSLTEIDVSDNALGKGGAEAFIGLCSACPTLKHVHANNGGLGMRGGRVIARELLDAQRKDTSVIERDDDDDAAAVSCRPELPGLPEGVVTQLESFTAGRNRLENPGAIALAHAFSGLSSLRRLELPQNGIFPEGICALSEALAAAGNLEVLNLNDNTVKVEGAHGLAKALALLPRMRELNVGDCLLDSEGTVAIATALASDGASREYRALDFSYNDVDDEAAVLVARVVAEQKNLERLELNGNMLKATGKEAINAALSGIGHEDALGSMSSNEDSDEDDDDDEEEDEYGDGTDGDTGDLERAVGDLKLDDE